MLVDSTEIIQFIYRGDHFLFILMTEVHLAAYKPLYISEKEKIRKMYVTHVAFNTTFLIET